MAFVRRVLEHCRILTRQFSFHVKQDPRAVRRLGYGAVFVGATAACCMARHGLMAHSLPVVEARGASHDKSQKDKKGRGPNIGYRQRRFLTYSSVEHGGVAYMTPRDFLESVMESEPRPRIGRRTLDDKELQVILRRTPDRGRGSPQMFRGMHDQGVISYSEYLFLLSILTKPVTGFRIAFNVLDKDQSQTVDKAEFLMMERALNRTLVKRLARWRRPDDEEEGEEKAPEIDEEQLDTMHLENTTVLKHLFGPRGDHDLTYEDFFKFMDDLQNEVIQLEFSEFSKGMPVISEEEFARVILRYTYTTTDDHDDYLGRLVKRLPEEIGITLEEFRDFFLLLTALDDFAIALSLHIMSDNPITQSEFIRASQVSLGRSLSPRVVQVIFALFDKNDDDRLAYREFLAIMKDRLHRGFRSHLITDSKSWDAFKTCMKQEMKVAS